MQFDLHYKYVEAENNFIILYKNFRYVYGYNNCYKFISNKCWFNINIFTNCVRHLYINGTYNQYSDGILNQKYKTVNLYQHHIIWRNFMRNGKKIQHTLQMPKWNIAQCYYENKFITNKIIQKKNQIIHYYWDIYEHKCSNIIFNKKYMIMYNIRWNCFRILINRNYIILYECMKSSIHQHRTIDICYINKNRLIQTVYTIHNNKPILLRSNLNQLNVLTYHDPYLIAESYYNVWRHSKLVMSYKKWFNCYGLIDFSIKFVSSHNQNIPYIQCYNKMGYLISTHQ